MAAPAEQPITPPLRTLPHLRLAVGDHSSPNLTPDPALEEDTKSDNILVESWNALKSWVAGLFSPKEAENEPSPAPQIVPITTVPPSATPIITPIPMPTPTPKPTPSERDRRALAAVDAAMAYADNNVRYTKGGTSDRTGFDCSGLIKDVCEGTNLVFGPGGLSYSARYMVNSFEKNKEFGDIKYDYEENKPWPQLKAGDLIFSANPDDLSFDRHVTMATGNGLQVVEASDRNGVNKVTYQFNAYDNVNMDGLYVRGTGQIVTYVIRPNY